MLEFERVESLSLVRYQIDRSNLSSVVIRANLQMGQVFLVLLVKDLRRFQRVCQVHETQGSIINNTQCS